MTEQSEHTDRVTAWVERYVRAWNSNDPADIGALFTDDARYYTEPYAGAWTGRQQIVDGWLEHRDEPGETTFSWRPVVSGPDLAIVQGETTYRTPPRTYSNMWVIRLAADDRCAEFTEWWMKHPDSA